MFRRNKTTILITTLVTILPMFIGLILWKQLPDQIPTHFGFQGQIDGYSSKIFAVVGLPLMMAAFQLVCAFVTSHDPRQGNISSKVFTFVLWIIPVISVFLTSLMYIVSLGHALDVTHITYILMGLILIIVGNYLPKSRRNYTVGIKTPWTLESDIVWNKTNRFGGYLFIVLGILMLVVAFTGIIPMEFFVILVLIATFVPMVYSYYLYSQENH